MKHLSMNRGAAAAQLLADPMFRAQWAELCDRCPWSTSYQSPAFAGAWYRVYAEKFEPVIVTARSETSSLCGILCLAVANEDGALVVAGANQSEYQSWVSDPELENEFAPAAVRLLRREFPSRLLEFRYLPPGVPLDWLKDRSLTSRVVLSKKSRPLLRFAQMTDSLSKANNKKRLKGLKKLGEMEFRRVTSAEELEEVFDDFIDFYDIRLGAMHGMEPFAEDPLKRSFQLELMKEPGLFHVTILTAGNLLASAHLNVCDRKQVHLNLIGYNPLLAKHSPGKFHIHMLSQMLIAQGCEELDLTPGGDPYKERFANAHDTSFVLSFHPTRLSQVKGIIEARGEAWARSGLSVAGIHPARARATAAKLRHLGVVKAGSSLAGQLGNWIFSQRETKFYGAGLSKDIEPRSDEGDFRRDCIGDLLAYRPFPSGPARKCFLSDAMTRLEEGQHPYTCVRDQQLIYVGWVMERPSEVYLSRVHPGLAAPQGCALITDLRPCGPVHEAELAPACLRAILSDLCRVNGIERAMMAVSRGREQIQLLEDAGFSWDRSVFVKTTLGRMRRWAWEASSPSACTAEVSQSAATR